MMNEKDRRGNSYDHHDQAGEEHSRFRDMEAETRPIDQDDDRRFVKGEDERDG